MSRRVRRWIVLGGLLVASFAGPARAIDVDGTAVRLQWGAASGPVAGYALYLSRDGGTFQEVQRVSSTSAQVSGTIGETVRVRVAAHDAQGRTGPQSPSSDAIRFIDGTNPPPPIGPPFDANGDGRADTFFFHAGSGELRVMLLQPDGTRVPLTIGVQENPDLRPVGYADVDADGLPDVLWRGAKTGANEIWLLRGESFELMPLPEFPTDWRMAAFRDFDANGRADVLWHRDETGESAVWWLDDGGVSTSYGVDPAPAGCVLAAVLDFDGDGYPDLAWKNLETGAVEAWLMRGVNTMALVGLGSVAPPAAVAESGDLDGDGDEDLVWSSKKGKKRVVQAWFLEGVETPAAGMAAQTSYSVLGLIDVDSDGRDEVVTRKKKVSAQSFKAFVVLPTGSVGEDGAMHWNVEPVPLESAPTKKSWSFLTAD